MYKILRPFIFFCLSPEQAHDLIIFLLKATRYVPFAKPIIRLLSKHNNPKLEKELFGLKFKNPVGLAAGFDKNGEVYNELSDFGFSFIEIGSLTPKAQGGNPKPRCFRLPEDSAIINRMGINNNGVKYAVEQIKKRHPKCIIGGNISKSTGCSNEDAPKDYEKSFARLYDFVDYFTINVSCPNVKDLCKLQDITALSEIIDKLLTMRRYFDDYRPILLKLSPDIPLSHLDDIIDLVLVSGLDGVIATNTSQSREDLITDKDVVESIGNGGLSGAPLFNRSIEVIKYINKKANGQLPIVAVGGIMSPKQAHEMLQAGASLIKIYSGFIYNGPGFVKEILQYLSKQKEYKLEEK